MCMSECVYVAKEVRSKCITNLQKRTDTRVTRHHHGRWTTHCFVGPLALSVGGLYHRGIHVDVQQGRSIPPSLSVSQSSSTHACIHAYIHTCMHPDCGVALTTAHHTLLWLTAAGAETCACHECVLVHRGLILVCAVVMCCAVLCPSGPLSGVDLDRRHDMFEVVKRATICKSDCAVKSVSAFISPRGSSSDKYFTVRKDGTCM